MAGPALEIEAWWRRARAGEVPRSDGMPRLTRKQGAEALLGHRTRAKLVLEAIEVVGPSIGSD